MKILEIKVLKGPNYWSVRRNKLIQMKLDLEEMEERPTHTIDGFRQRLEKLFPTLQEHRCSEGVRGHEKISHESFRRRRRLWRLQCRNSMRPTNSCGARQLSR